MEGASLPARSLSSTSVRGIKSEQVKEMNVSGPFQLGKLRQQLREQSLDFVAVFLRFSISSEAGPCGGPKTPRPVSVTYVM